MKNFVFTMMLVACVANAMAVEPTTINFNLVQVNQYPGQEEAASKITTPGRRIVVDLSRPETTLQYLAATASIPIKLAKPSSRKVTYVEGEQVMLPWETSVVMYTPSGTDSFLVSSSRTGCPGTEVGPSVAVAFATYRGWSDPPIRFGPLTSKTICSLGKGAELEVNGMGPNPPVVRLIEESAMYGRK
jgi:hypothetical protein